MSREYWEPLHRVKIEPEDIKEEIEEKFVKTEHINIAKGTTDSRVEFYLPK